MALVYLIGVLNGHLAIGRLAVINVAGAGVNAVLAYPISVLVNTGYLVAFVAMITLSLSAQIVIGFSKAYRHRYLRPIVANGFRFRLRKDATRSFFAVAGTMMITSIVASVSLLFIRALIVQYGGMTDAGIFNVAWVICMAYPMVILNSFGAYYLPTLSQTKNREERNVLMRNVFRLTTILIVPLELLVIILKPLMIDVLYSEEFYPSLVILRWMMVGIYLKAASWVFAMPMFSFVDMKTHFWTGNLWYAGFVGFSLLAVVYLDNLEVIGIGFVVVYGAYLAYTMRYAHSRFGFSLDRPLIVTWTVGLALVIAASILTWSETRTDFFITLVFVVVAASYLSFSVTKRERGKAKDLLIRVLTGQR